MIASTDHTIKSDIWNKSIIREIFKIMLSITLLMAVMNNVFTSVSASPPEDEPVVVFFEQQDLDGDNKPDRAIIRADYMNRQYTVTVYDQNFDMIWSDNWKKGTDFVNDIWLFQDEMGIQTKLIIRFSHSSDGFLAELFDDFDGNGDISYRIQNMTHVEILESAFPTVRMVADQYWLLPDEKVNYIVRSTINRPLPIWFLQSQYFQYLPPEGLTSFSGELVDSDGDGNPDYEFERAFPEVPDYLYPFSSRITVNIDDSVRPNFHGEFFWPYLCLTTSENWSEKQLLRRLEDNSPPIKVDLNLGRINGVESFLPIWGLGNQWILFSIKPIEKYTVNELDWEIFSYYDFNQDTYMDMLMRVLFQPAEPVQIGSKSYYPKQTSIAWHHKNPESIKWDFEIETASLVERPTTIVGFNDFAVYTTPYEDLPWLFNDTQTWAYATLVAAESDPTNSNEGIWEWGTLEGVQTDLTLPAEERFVEGAMTGQHAYLRGQTEVSPSIFYETIRAGYRGEYSDLNAPAQLYFSAIDRKLHLFKATKGVWNLGESREIRYESLGSDYLNHWILLDDGQPQENLYFLDGILIYQYGETLELIKLDKPEALLLTQPPRDRSEWEALGSQLNQYQPDFAPDDFEAMLSGISGPRLSIESASIQDTRPSASGFRFMLTVEAGYSIDGDDLFQGQVLAPGSYVISIDNGSLGVQQATPAKISLDISVQLDRLQPPVAFVRVLNEGLVDLNRATLMLTEVCGAQQIILLERELDLYAQETQQILASMSPASEQSCLLRAEVKDQNGFQMLVVDKEFSGTATNETSLVVQVFGLNYQISLYILLAFLVLIMGLTTYTIFRH